MPVLGLWRFGHQKIACAPSIDLDASLACPSQTSPLTNNRTWAVHRSRLFEQFAITPQPVSVFFWFLKIQNISPAHAPSVLIIVGRNPSRKFRAVQGLASGAQTPTIVAWAGAVRLSSKSGAVGVSSKLRTGAEVSATFSASWAIGLNWGVRLLAHHHLHEAGIHPFPSCTRPLELAPRILHSPLSYEPGSTNDVAHWRSRRSERD